MLYVVPIVHSPEDLGSLLDSTENRRFSLTTPEARESSRAAVRSFWSGLTDVIEEWQVDFSSLTVYQDALPVCESSLQGIEQQIIDELAGKGSRNHQILQWLRERGAVVLGTESASLLIEEYRQMKEILEQDNDSECAEQALSQQAAQENILRLRDEFIAKRIDTTLQDSQTGLIFLGLLHHLEVYLPSDILAVYPFGRPSRPKVRL